ncbi:MAG: DUF5615 family PIN-like protein [Saprospiraceae bacterium]
MKILLDECVTRKLKKHLSGFAVQTVTELDLSGLKNGKLLAAAEQMGFEVLLTIDKNIDSQQNISKFNLTLVVFDAVKSNVKYLAPLVPSFLAQMPDFEKGKTYVIS